MVLKKNEVRGIIGFKPLDDPVADTLHNPQLYPEEDVPTDDQNELASPEEIKKKLKENSGYCPCRLDKTKDTKCMCKEFREQIADPNYEGYCHCMLYYKSYEN